MLPKLQYSIFLTFIALSIVHSHVIPSTAVFCICGTVWIENLITYKTNGRPEIGNPVREISQVLPHSNDILLPPLLIKQGLMKNFVKSMNKDGEAFQYLR